ncbi:MAG: hypothetical protein ACR2OO_09570 [Thermomicrobiales bacterium]
MSKGVLKPAQDTTAVRVVGPLLMVMSVGVVPPVSVGVARIIHVVVLMHD